MEAQQTHICIVSVSVVPLQMRRPQVYTRETKTAYLNITGDNCNFHHDPKSVANGLAVVLPTHLSEVQASNDAQSYRQKLAGEGAEGNDLCGLRCENDFFSVVMGEML